MTTLDAATRKAFGIFLTPEAIARFMASRIASTGAPLRILDPAAGCGVLVCAAIERLLALPEPPRSIHVTAYEIQPVIYGRLCDVLRHAQLWAAERGTDVTLDTHCDDFIDSHARRPLFGLVRGNFDLVIANPPYFKLSSDDPRCVALSPVIPNQPNIYSMFMTLTALEVRTGGQIIYIVPRSFASGVYFKPFRRWFFSRVQPMAIHVFSSRRQAFKRDAVLQENIILFGQRSGRVDATASITMSQSEGIDDLHAPTVWNAPWEELCNVKPDYLLRLPQSPDDLESMRAIDRLPCTLTTLGLSISTGPVVAFRARDSIVDEPGPTTIPLLWLGNVQPGRFEWPLIQRTGQHLDARDPKLSIPMQNIVVVRRFSAKDEPRRLTAAALLASQFPYQRIGIENHLNYIYRHGTMIEDHLAIGLAAILNDPLMDRYFRTVSGNTQVGAAELRSFPLPTMDTIVTIGQRVQAGTLGDEETAQRVLHDSTARGVPALQSAWNG